MNPVEMLIAGAAFALLDSFVRRVLADEAASPRASIDPTAVDAAIEVVNEWKWATS